MLVALRIAPVAYQKDSIQRVLTSYICIYTVYIAYIVHVELGSTFMIIKVEKCLRTTIVSPDEKFRNCGIQSWILLWPIVPF